MADGIPQGWKQVTDPNQLNQDMTERPVPGLYKATVPGIKSDNGRSNSLPVVTNSSNGNFQVYEQTIFGDKPIYSYNASNNKTTINDNEKYKRYFSGDEGKKQYDTLNKTVKTRTLEISEKNAKGDGGGISPEVAKKQLEDLKKSEGYKSTTTPTSQATDPDKKPEEGAASNATADQFKLIEDAAKGYVGRKAGGYPQSLKYPENMNINQDCIQFAVMEYQASKLGLDSNINTGLRTTARTALTTITLPMPRAISDRNSVDWSKSEIGALDKALGDVALKGIIGGPAAGTDAAKKNLDAATPAGGNDLLKAIIAAKATEIAVGTGNLLSRIYGVQMNPNAELLFGGPSLRDFSFSFKMTPRSPEEAKIVRAIIRTFKQAMSVKRSNSVFLLKSPHTFMIKYITSNKEHPYLNRFKECALTNCSVDYTPDGQYMSYDSGDPDERSMTAYELSLSFYELEPIFDDDYDKIDPSKEFKSIGY